jgi:hypothetical protein
MVAIRDEHCDGRPERLAPSHAADELDAIGLDLHTGAAPVPLLAPCKVDVHVFRKQR